MSHDPGDEDRRPVTKFPADGPTGGRAAGTYFNETEMKYLFKLFAGDAGVQGSPAHCLRIILHEQSAQRDRAELVNIWTKLGVDPEWQSPK